MTHVPFRQTLNVYREGMFFAPALAGLGLLFEHDLRANAFRVCREGKPLPTFPDHAQFPVFTLVQSRLMMRWVAGSRAVITKSFASVASSG
jgi:hypothetical protein